MPTKTLDWDAEARKAATHFATHHPDIRRHAMAWEAPGVCVLMGNDGYREPRSWRFGRALLEVLQLRTFLANAGIAELGFGLAAREGAESEGDEGRSWAMMVRADDPEPLADLL